MQNRQGWIKATTPPDDSNGGGTDNSLPDPTLYAKLALAGLMLLALVVAIVMNAAGWTAAPFNPSKNVKADFALFAGFYVAAQVIERLLQLISPLLPSPWGWPNPATGDAARAAQLKADRANVTLGVAAIAGVLASCAFGLFFLQAIGISASNTVDCFVTGITIAAGTKPLHDFITLLQNKNSPATGTTA